MQQAAQEHAKQAKLHEIEAAKKLQQKNQEL